MKTQFTKEQRQLKQIADHLTENKSITSWDAIEKYRITRLSHYIYLLRREGWSIATETKVNKDTGTNYGLYLLN
jgi:hypothetical protein